MLRASRIRVDSTTSAWSPDASSHASPPSGSIERSSTRIPPLLEHLDLVAQGGGQLELFQVHGSAKPVAELQQRRRPFHRLRLRRTILAPRVLRVPVHAPEQL